MEEVHDPDEVWEDWGGPSPDRARSHGEGSITPDELIDALPGLSRIALGAAWHTGGWALGASQRLAGRMAKAARSPREAVRLADDTRKVTARVLRTASLLLDEQAAAEVRLSPFGEWPSPATRPSTSPQADLAPPAGPRGAGDDRQEPAARSPQQPTLRERAAELLERSRDVNDQTTEHPAYERIVEELAPDEARVLLLLLLDGPQPSVDVRTGGPIGMVRSRLIAPGLSMIGARAGLRYLDRVPAYLNNLFRLGLIWFSREALPDTGRYQLLEAQPDVAAALATVAYAKVVRRSVHLTPFGEDFCRVALAPEATRMERLPEHANPSELDPDAPEL